MSELKQAIQAADEAYLIALANKGIYNRACRELAGSGVNLQWEGDTLTATFADDTVTTLTGSVQHYQCGCPSRSICKHVLMAILAAKRDAAGDTKDAPPPDYSPIQKMDFAALEKLTGKKAYREAVFQVRSGSAATIQEDATLTVTLGDSGRTVRFLPGQPVERAACDCKAEGCCAHKAEAVLHCILQAGGSLPEEEPEAEHLEEVDRDTPGFVAGFVADIFSTGLARLPTGTRQRMEQVAVICHSRRLANLERLCSRAAGQLQLLEQKSARFEMGFLLDDLSAIVEQCHRLQQGERGRELVGVFREEYRPVTSLELFGLGAYQWRSTGGYMGVTTVFFSPSQGRAVTFTVSLPESARTDPFRMYDGPAPWNLPTKLAFLCRTHLQLKNGKLSGKFQLSATESATATVAGATDLSDPLLKPILFPTFDQLVRQLWEEGGDSRSLTAILQPARWGPAEFDQIKQQLTLRVYDAAERGLTLRVRYQPATKPLIDNLLWMDGQDALQGPLLARVSADDGKLSAFPIACYPQGEAFNLSLDKSHTAEQSGNKYYNW